MITLVTIYSAEDIDKLDAYAKPSGAIEGVRKVYLQTVLADASHHGMISESPGSTEMETHATWYYEDFSFAEARNAAISLCKTEWIFMIDSDESLHNLNFSGIDFAKIPETVGGVLVNNVLLQLSRDGMAVVPQTITHTRIFRNDPRIRYTNRCHEQVLESITAAGFDIMESDIVLVHHGYRADDAALERKFRRNIRLMLMDLSEPTAQDDPVNYKYLSEKLFHTYRDLDRLGGSVV